MKSFRVLAGASVVAGSVLCGSGVVVATSAASAIKNCAPAQLKVTLGHPQGAAGTSYYPVVFTNTRATCALWGVPLVQPVVGGASHSRVKVGPASRNTSMGMMPVRHVIGSGRSVSSAFGVTETGNYPANVCRARSADAVVVTLGSFVTQSYIPVRISVCTKQASTTSRLIIVGTSGT